MSQYPELMAAGREGGLAPEIVEQYSSMVDMHIGGAVLFALLGLALVVGIEMASSLIARHRGQKDTEEA